MMNEDWELNAILLGKMKTMMYFLVAIWHAIHHVKNKHASNSKILFNLY
jgi:hypothetical protein